MAMPVGFQPRASMQKELRGSSGGGREGLKLPYRVCIGTSDLLGTPGHFEARAARLPRRWLRRLAASVRPRTSARPSGCGVAAPPAGRTCCRTSRAPCRAPPRSSGGTANQPRASAPPTRRTCEPVTRQVCPHGRLVKDTQALIAMHVKLACLASPTHVLPASSRTA